LTKTQILCLFACLQAMRRPFVAQHRPASAGVQDGWCRVAYCSALMWLQNNLNSHMARSGPCTPWRHFWLKRACVS
jgi:hypothetical protein